MSAADYLLLVALLEKATIGRTGDGKRHDCEVMAQGRFLKGYGCVFSHGYNNII